MPKKGANVFTSSSEQRTANLHMDIAFQPIKSRVNVIAVHEPYTSVTTEA